MGFLGERVSSEDSLPRALRDLKTWEPGVTDIEAIRARQSVRSYDGKPLTADERASLGRALESNRTGPFGGEVELALIDLDEAEGALARAKITYGVIRGAKSYVVGSVESPNATVDIGYCFERVVVEATKLGLGTCWIGGTFSRSAFAARAKVTDGWLIPCVSPVGHDSGSRSLIERSFRLFAGSHGRKPWAELFFLDAAGAPLTPEVAGAFADALECVRIGPSAANVQPWRVLAEPKTGSFHFGLSRRHVYDRSISTVSLQEVDLGIALCHFELACREKSIAGHWRRDAAPALPAGVEYIATWTGEGGQP
jgi:nitroreductase